MKKIWYDENGNARCGKCMRLLYKCKGGEKSTGIEIKCHSCKELNVSEFRYCYNCKWSENAICMNSNSDYFLQECEKYGYCDCWTSKGNGEKSNQRRD